MDNSKKIIEEIQSVISKYRYEPIESGGMLRYAQNKDEIVIFIPISLSERKNILIIYERNNTHDR
jgi:hypothetical protein